jgi:hypothetical protein
MNKKYQIGSIALLVISVILFVQGMAVIEVAVCHIAQIGIASAAGIQMDTNSVSTINTGTAYVSTGFAIAMIVVTLNILKK